MRKKVNVVLSTEAEKIYAKWNWEESKPNKLFLAACKQKWECLKADAHYGEPISKTKIPKTYKIKYGIKNLFWVNLPHGWRLLYTLTNDNDEITAFVLDIMNHKQYNKKFGYK